MATEKKITLRWPAATEADLAGYRVYWSPVKGYWVGCLATLSKAKTSLVLTLPAAAHYYFAVTSFDVAGNESAKRVIAV